MHVKNYIKLYLKKQMILAVLIPMAMLAAFLLLSLFEPSIRGRVLEVSCVFAGIFSLPVFFSLAFILRFRRMINKQERELHVMFQDSNATALVDETLVYLSDNWLICAGTMAFHREYIRNVTWHRELSTRAGRGYRMRIETIDKKYYRLFLQTARSCRKIHGWWHGGGEKDSLEVMTDLWNISAY